MLFTINRITLNTFSVLFSAIVVDFGNCNASKVMLKDVLSKKTVHKNVRCHVPKQLQSPF